MSLGFREGARAVLSGARRLLGDSRLRALAIAPLLVTLFVEVVGLGVAALFVDDLLARLWAPPEGALRALWWAAAAVLFLAMGAALALAFVFLATAISGPFQEKIACLILDEREIPRRDLGFFEGLAVDVSWALLFAIPCAVLAVLALIPVVGIVAALSSLTLASTGLAVAAVGPALNATGEGLGARFRLLKERPRFVAGAALVLAGSILVPAVGLLAVPAAVIGMTERLIEAGAFARGPLAAA